MRAAAWVLTAMSAVLWGLAGLSTWACLDERALVIEALAACTATVLAGAWWIVETTISRSLDRAVRDRTVRRLGDALITSRRGALRATLPFPRPVRY